MGKVVALLPRWRRLSNSTLTRERPLVMVADDDVLVCRLLATGLTRSGFRVRAFRDGAELLRAVGQQTPAAVVVDWLMPGLQGPEICERLKQDAQTSAVPVLMLTSRAADRDVAQALGCGADEYVTKPFHVDEVVRLLRQLAHEGARR